MIKYNLKCKNKHEFESWFSNSKEYEKLKKKKLLECIYCKSIQIEKSIMSPRVLNKRILSKKYKNDKKTDKKIYGTTTQEEREELKEEGIDLVSIPWIKKDN